LLASRSQFNHAFSRQHTSQPRTTSKKNLPFLIDTLDKFQSGTAEHNRLANNCLA